MTLRYAGKIKTNRSKDMITPPISLTFFFIGLLLSLSLAPLLLPKFWHLYEKHILGFWSGGCAICLSHYFGFEQTFGWLWAMLLHEYMPFIVLVIAIFTINSGFHLDIQAPSTPFYNITILTVASLCSSIIGPTGASMVFLRPLIRMNSARQHKVHTILFFIFTVANVGGALTPLGDPPIFIGFLKGVDFFWPTKHLLAPFGLTMVMLLGLYGIIDCYLWSKEEKTPKISRVNIFITGKRNFVFLFCMILAVPLSTMVSFPKIRLGTEVVQLNFIIRDILLLGLAFFSYRTTSPDIRRRNHFSWAPLSEVASVFLAIFTTMIPVSLILDAGRHGPLSGLFHMVDQGPFAYFWLSGLLSAFLDNAPTYLLFFQLAGDNASDLMKNVVTLQAISLGTVLFGAVTYIGNTPNLVIRSIAKQHDIPMPSFLGYLGWSSLFLLPVFYILSLVFF